MNKIRIILVLLLFLFTLSLSTVMGQDSTEEGETAPAGTFVITAETGTLTAVEDDNFQLTLEDVSTYARWLITEPNVSAGQYDLFEFSNDWSFASEEETLSTPAVLSTTSESITLSLSDPVYNAEDATLTYNASVESVEAFDAESNDAKADVPETLDDITLFVPLTDAFNRAMVEGRAARAEETRLSNVEDDDDCSFFNFPDC